MCQKQVEEITSLDNTSEAHGDWTVSLQVGETRVTNMSQQIVATRKWSTIFIAISGSAMLIVSLGYCGGQKVASLRNRLQRQAGYQSCIDRSRAQCTARPTRPQRWPRRGPHLLRRITHAGESTAPRSTEAPAPRPFGRITAGCRPSVPPPLSLSPRCLPRWLPRWPSPARATAAMVERIACTGGRQRLATA